MSAKALPCALLAAGCMAAAPGQQGVPPDKLMPVGSRMALDYERQTPLLNDSEVSAYAGRIAQRLARVAGLDSASLKVAANSETHARVFPGGFLYLDAGLILRQATDRELAGVIAHLIAHAAVPPRKTGMATIPLWFGCARYGAPAPRSAAHLEQDSDRLAEQYVEKAGYDTSVLDPEFERVKERVRTALAPAPKQKPSLKQPD
jgi:predicted Zn-dependent protease